MAELIRKVGISEQTVLSMENEVCWHGNSTRFGRLKQLQEENSRLKQLVADLKLDKTMLQDVMRKKF